MVTGAASLTATDAIDQASRFSRSFLDKPVAVRCRIDTPMLRKRMERRVVVTSAILRGSTPASQIVDLVSDRAGCFVDPSRYRAEKAPKDNEPLRL